MQEEDFNLYFFAFPIFGALLGIILSAVGQGTYFGITCMLGVIAGYLALIAMILFNRAKS